MIGDWWRLHGLKGLVALMLLAGGGYWMYGQTAGQEQGDWLTVNAEMEELLAAGTTVPQGEAATAAGMDGGKNPPAPPAAATAAPSAAPGGQSPADTAVLQPSSAPAASLPPAAAVPNAININTAGASRLTGLPGIGPSKAKAIVDYREANGPFAAPEDLKKVKGIGEKTYSALKSRITVQ